MNETPALPAFAQSLPVKTLAAGEFLVREGTRSGQVYVLDTGRLTVWREGVMLASVDRPGALIGEMAVLLMTNHSASVRADGPVTVRVLENGAAAFAADPELALHVARISLGRLNTTSALLVELQHAARNRPTEKALVDRILTALTGSAAPQPRRHGRVRFDHE